MITERKSESDNLPVAFPFPTADRLDSLLRRTFSKLLIVKAANGEGTEIDNVDARSRASMRKVLSIVFFDSLYAISIADAHRKWPERQN